MQAVGSRVMNMRGALTMGRTQMSNICGRVMASTCTTATSEPERSVFISQSSDIHTNLALEDWLYKNNDFEKHRILLLWRNDPSVVIGRHQNLWTEVDVGKAASSGIAVARRNSGGGSVYHDHGNLNCTFFTPRDAYCRVKNLKVVKSALNRDFGIDTEITPRHDITLGGGKISGTASKLGKNAYHHLTLLVDADLKSLSSILNPNVDGVETRATKSVKATVSNLIDSNPSITVDSVLTSIGYEFLRTDKNGNDGGEEAINKQRGFKLVNPSNQWFPGIDKIKAELKSWNWNAGRTPPFSIQRTYVIPSGGEVKLDLEITKGFIGSATLNFSADVNSTTRADLSGFISALKERPYHPGVLTTLEGLLLNKSEFNVFSQEQFVGDQVEEVMEVVKDETENRYSSTIYSL